MRREPRGVWFAVVATTAILAVLFTVLNSVSQFGSVIIGAVRIFRPFLFQFIIFARVKLFGEEQGLSERVQNLHY